MNPLIPASPSTIHLSKAMGNGQVAAITQISEDVAMVLNKERKTATISNGKTVIELSFADIHKLAKTTPVNCRTKGHVVSAANRERYEQAAALWREGKSVEQLSRRFRISINSAATLILRARKVLGLLAVPHRAMGRPPGKYLKPSPLDQLKTVGDELVLKRSEIGTRQNIEQTAMRRGWVVTIVKQGDSWGVAAVSRTGDIRRAPTGI